MQTYFKIAVSRLRLATLSSMMALLAHSQWAYSDPPAAQDNANLVMRGLKVSISLQDKKTTFLPTEPIILKVTVKNISSQLIELTERGGDAVKGIDWNVVVLDAAGRVMPHTRYGSNSISFSLNSHGLAPNAEDHLTLMANRMADMTLYGRYDITVKRKILNFTRSGPPMIEVPSNTVRVVVNEPLSKSNPNILTQHGPAKIRH